jgi:molecular chaperone DnaJ
VRSGATGDLMCKVYVETPVNLTKRQKELLQELGESLETDSVEHSPRSSGWLDSVKKFFEDMKF